jgi:hypothetical protein
MGFTVVDTKPETNHVRVGSYGGHQRYVDTTASGCIKLCGEEVGAANGMFRSTVHPLAESNSNASAQARSFLNSNAVRTAAAKGQTSTICGLEAPGALRKTPQAPHTGCVGQVPQSTCSCKELGCNLRAH